MKRYFAILLGAALLVGAPNSNHAEQVITNVLSFDGVPAGPINGLTVQGVTFGFQVGGVASIDARVGTVGPGPTPFNFPPNVEGAANGVLTLNFTTPTLLLQFGSHLNAITALPVGLTVQIFDAALSPVGAPIPLAMPATAGVVGGMFSYSGGVVGRAVIDFNETAASRFALDNVTYTLVPEPNTAWLAFAGLAIWAMWRRPWQAAR